ncbi:MAG: hypothetical protein P1U40_01385 [Coxiellaceae bacterium]|nr:hypothetical protein [Coxiellaceae bacterium]
MNTNKLNWHAPELTLLSKASTLGGNEMPLGETAMDFEHESG